MANWKAHGVKLNARFEIKHNLFVIIQVIEDQQNATGCSIDASVHALKEFQTQFGINFFNRQRVAYFIDNELKECSMNEFKTLAKEDIVNENTIVFDNTVTNISDFETKWQTTAANSWHKMLLQ